MWKDFLYFSRGERRAIVALTVIIILIQIALWTADCWIPVLPEKLTKIAGIQQELKVFKDTLSGQNKYESYRDTGLKHSSYSNSSKLTNFDPNTADSADFVSFGLRPHIAKNILKYRSKGGVFRKAEDFARVYGLSSEQFERMKPFIKIHSEKTNYSSSSVFSGLEDERTPFSALDSETISDTTVSEGSELILPQNGASKNLSSFTSMEVNRVDTVILQQLKGVGGITANRIVQYRNRLGGFYSISQLKEINGIYPDALSRLQILMKVDTTQIVRINANKASLEKLKSHPYLSFYQAKVIVELRKARSGIKNIGELAEFKEFSKADIERLKWYLAF
ncbi:MAG: helix-hairpin-helix domain-containing protein [Bacteroidales bacterium]|nr:helix-hairpin-helix domain-containing protein [Bacteroidales bacterium]